MKNTPFKQKILDKYGIPEELYEEIKKKVLQEELAPVYEVAETLINIQSKIDRVIKHLFNEPVVYQKRGSVISGGMRIRDRIENEEIIPTPYIKVKNNS